MDGGKSQSRRLGRLGPLLGVPHRNGPELAQLLPNLRDRLAQLPHHRAGFLGDAHRSARADTDEAARPYGNCRVATLATRVVARLKPHRDDAAVQFQLERGGELVVGQIEVGNIRQRQGGGQPATGHSC